MNYFPALRRDFIRWRLAVLGEIQRADLIRTFLISEAQASADINSLLTDQPSVATYDKSAKRYIGRKHQPGERLAKLADAHGWD